MLQTVGRLVVPKNDDNDLKAIEDALSKVNYKLVILEEGLTETVYIIAKCDKEEEW